MFELWIFEMILMEDLNVNEISWDAWLDSKRLSIPTMKRWTQEDNEETNK